MDEGADLRKKTIKRKRGKCLKNDTAELIFRKKHLGTEGRMEAALGQNEHGKKPRMANLELLRCIAMMMVVVLHFLGKGNLLEDISGPSMSGTGYLAWFLEALCIVAVNVYMLISGYFLCSSSFKPGRLLQLMLQLWFYSIGVGLLAVVFGIVPAGEVNTHYFLSLLFPVSMEHYWFMTAYVFLYLLLPFIGSGISKMTKKQMQTAIWLLLFVFCILKSILPVRLEADAKGYDCIWYLCVFLTAAYIRRFGLRFTEKKRNSLLLYLGSAAAVWAELFALRTVYLKTGSMQHILQISLEYNHVFVFAASVGLFCFFLKIRISGRFAGFVKKIAPYTLGVYLLHENIGIRYVWPEWFGAARVNSVGSLLLYTFLAAIGMFVFGIAVDICRSFLMRGLGVCVRKVPFGRKLAETIKKEETTFEE